MATRARIEAEDRCDGHGCFVCRLPREVREPLARDLFRVAFPTRTTLAHEGEPADRLFAVCAGSLRLLSYREDGRAQVLAAIRPGGLVGLQTALLSTPLPFSLESREPTTAWVMPWVAVRRLLAERPQLWPRFARAAAVRYHETLDELKKSPFARLVHLLLGDGADNGAAGVRMTEQELGEAVGLSARSVRRHLARLREAGLVARRGRRLHVVDPARLSRLAVA